MSFLSDLSIIIRVDNLVGSAYMSTNFQARVAELADALDLGSSPP